MKWNPALLIAALVSVGPNLSAQQQGNAGDRIRSVARPNGEDCLYNYGNGWYYGAYWDARCHAYEPYVPYMNLMFIVPAWQAPAAAVPSQVQSAATPILHEYSWPDSRGDASAFFTIVSKRGAFQHAVAVWVQDGELCFIAPDGLARQLPLGEIDYQETTRVNAQSKLKLPLPAQNQDHELIESAGGRQPNQYLP